MMTDVAQAELPPSLIAFLFAHRFASVAKPGEMGTLSLANGAVVETDQLARMLVIIALWSLHDRGAIALEPFSEKKLRFITWTGVRVRLLEPIQLGGIEGQVISRLAREKKGRDPGMQISTLVHLLYKDMRDKVRPELTVRKRAVDELVELGYAERPSKDDLQPCKERIAAVEPALEQFTARWRAFRDQQTELTDQLVGAVADAFNNIQPDR
jgi:hypothetical protein